MTLRSMACGPPGESTEARCFTSSLNPNLADFSGTIFSSDRIGTPLAAIGAFWVTATSFFSTAPPKSDACLDFEQAEGAIINTVKNTTAERLMGSSIYHVKLKVTDLIQAWNHSGSDSAVVAMNGHCGRLCRDFSDGVKTPA